MKTMPALVQAGTLLISNVLFPGRLANNGKNSGEQDILPGAETHDIQQLCRIETVQRTEWDSKTVVAWKTSITFPLETS